MPLSPEDLKAEIAAKRDKFNAKFGAGEFERRLALIKPHRCARHLDDFYYGLSKLNLSPGWNMIKCFAGVEGLELVYKDAPAFLLTKELEIQEKREEVKNK